MSKANYANKKIWFTIAGEATFIIVANNEKECKELVDELSEGTITATLRNKPIGNMCPTMKFYDNWEGESFVITTNFYNL
jgi:hypothetical protein